MTSAAVTEVLPRVDRPARTLPHVPALDGVRGLAVAAVLAFHGGVAAVHGGFLGVDAFFVLSGFLITSLLLVEHAGSGRIRLGAFWARRARRLLPALLVLLATVGLVSRWRLPRADRAAVAASAHLVAGHRGTVLRALAVAGDRDPGCHPKSARPAAAR